MKFETEVRVKKNQAGDAKKTFIVLGAALLATSVYVFFQRVYLLRELLLAVACAAILVFFAANLAALGFLFHAAGRSIRHNIRKATPRIAQPDKAHAEQHLGPLLVSPTISAAPGLAGSECEKEQSGVRGMTVTGPFVPRGSQKARIIMKLKFSPPIVLCAILAGVLPLGAQQKGQYVPGQFGLNAGIMPSPGFTYANMEINYNTSTLNDNNGNAIPPNPTLNLWVVENIFEFVVPNTKFLGGHLGFLIIVPTIANGSLTLEQVNVSGSTYGLADTWVQPFTVGWHLKRADIRVGDAIMCPTGRYSPGALNNIGSGYFGNHVIMGATVYLTKNKGTSANIFTDWEAHGQKQITQGSVYKTPGQAFTDEWGVGQILPLSKDLSKLLQLGAIGYDQWQVTANGGSFAITGPLGNTLILPASTLPFYSVHAVGGQATFILPKRNLALFFKYEHEYAAYSHTLGNTLVFGGSWTLRIPESSGAKK